MRPLTVVAAIFVLVLTANSSAAEQSLPSDITIGEASSISPSPIELRSRRGGGSKTYSSSSRRTYSGVRRGGGSRGGCGSRGGPGYRKPNGKCASWRD